MLRLTAVIGLALVLAPSSAQAAPCAGFTDVDDASPFCSNVTWMKNRGVTLGCALSLYCPADPVNRLQMAIFMNRMADALFPLTCSAGQIMKWNGGSWTCANDAIGAGGGTVTSVMAGTGLTAAPNPITASGALNLATSYQLPQACGANQVPKWNGSAWICAADGNSGGTVTSVAAGAGLTGGPITGSGTLAIASGGVTAAMLAGNGCANGQVLKYNGAAWACSADNTVANAFVQHGNAFNAEATLGTNDQFALNLKAGGTPVMRYFWTGISPNLIGGNANYAVFGVRGATIGGGGVVSGDNDPDYGFEGPNFATDHYGTIGGGYANQVGDNTGTLADRPFGVVAGGAFNIASGAYAAVTGGGANLAVGDYGFVGGGEQNRAQGARAVVSGGFQNQAPGLKSAVGGGELNTANGNFSTVGGGQQNSAALSAAVSGGRRNIASGQSSSVGGGDDNVATQAWSAIAGGTDNLASGESSAVGGGTVNKATGRYATVPGGLLNVASGEGSFAAGQFARASAAGCFVWSDGNFLTECTIPYAFTARANGGFYLITGDGTGVQVSAGASFWSTLSDRQSKERFEPVDPIDVLARLVKIPIERWSYKAERSGARHMGPVAQDFHKAFALGDDDRRIGTVDADGVALAAVQGLYHLLERQAETIKALEARLAAQDARIAELRAPRSDVAIAKRSRTATSGARLNYVTTAATTR